MIRRSKSVETVKSRIVSKRSQKLRDTKGEDENYIIPSIVHLLQSKKLNFAVALDSRGNIFVARARSIKKITPKGQVTTFPCNTAHFRSIVAFTIDNVDNLYVVDTYGLKILTPKGEVLETFSIKNLCGVAVVHPSSGRRIFVLEELSTSQVSLKEITSTTQTQSLAIFKTGSYMNQPWFIHEKKDVVEGSGEDDSWDTNSFGFQISDDEMSDLHTVPIFKKRLFGLTVDPLGTLYIHTPTTIFSFTPTPPTDPPNPIRPLLFAGEGYYHHQICPLATFKDIQGIAFDQTGSLVVVESTQLVKVVEGEVVVIDKFWEIGDDGDKGKHKREFSSSMGSLGHFVDIRGVVVFKSNIVIYTPYTVSRLLQYDQWAQDILSTLYTSRDNHTTTYPTSDGGTIKCHPYVLSTFLKHYPKPNSTEGPPPLPLTVPEFFGNLNSAAAEITLCCIYLDSLDLFPIDSVPVEAFFEVWKFALSFSMKRIVLAVRSAIRKAHDVRNVLEIAKLLEKNELMDEISFTVKFFQDHEADLAPLLEGDSDVPAFLKEVQNLKLRKSDQTKRTKKNEQLAKSEHGEKPTRVKSNIQMKSPRKKKDTEPEADTETGESRPKSKHDIKEIEGEQKSTPQPKGTNKTKVESKPKPKLKTEVELKVKPTIKMETPKKNRVDVEVKLKKEILEDSGKSYGKLKSPKLRNEGSGKKAKPQRSKFNEMEKFSPVRNNISRSLYCYGIMRDIFMTREQTGDFSLTVQDGLSVEPKRAIMNIHVAVLVATSGYFLTKFSTRFSQNELDEEHFTEMPISTFTKLLSILYLGMTTEQLTTTDALFMLCSVDYYDVKGTLLLDLCVRELTQCDKEVAGNIIADVIFDPSLQINFSQLLATVDRTPCLATLVPVLSVKALLKSSSMNSTSLETMKGKMKEIKRHSIQLEEQMKLLEERNKQLEQNNKSLEEGNKNHLSELKAVQLKLTEVGDQNKIYLDREKKMQLQLNQLEMTRQRQLEEMKAMQLNGMKLEEWIIQFEELFKDTVVGNRKQLEESQELAAKNAHMEEELKKMKDILASVVSKVGL